MLTTFFFCACDQPTRADRGWLVMPFGKNPWWWYLASAVPALLVTILIFMDQQISAVIVNRKENKLKVRLWPNRKQKAHITKEIIINLRWFSIYFIMITFQVPYLSNICHFNIAEKLWLPLGSVLGGGANGCVLLHGLALVCGSYRHLHCTHRLLKDGARVQRSRGTAAVPRSEVTPFWLCRQWRTLLTMAGAQMVECANQ